MSIARPGLALPPQLVRRTTAALQLRGMLRFAAGLLLLAIAGSAETPLEKARRLEQGSSAAANAYEAALPGLRSGDRKVLAQVLFETGQAWLAAGDARRAVDRSSEAATLFRRDGDAAGEAAALNIAGSAQLRLAQYPAALDLFRAALALDRRRHDVHGEVVRLGNIGNAFFFQSKYLDARENYESALRRAVESAGQPWAAGRRQVALTNLAILCEQLGQHQRAMDYYQHALADGAGQSPAERGQVLSKVGALYRRMGNTGKALESYEAAGNLFAQERASDAQIHVLQNAGVALRLDLGDAARAESSFSKALQLAEATGSRREIALAHLFRGESLFRRSDLARAMGDFEAALAGAREIGAPDEQWTALYGIARIARLRADSALALARLREAIAVLESGRSSLSNPPNSDFLPDQRDVYDAAIGLLLQSPQRDAGQLFRLFEQARSRNLRDAMRGSTAPPPLASVQKRLTEGSALVEYWIGDGRLAMLTVTRGGYHVTDRAWTAEDGAAVRAWVAGLQRAQDASWRSGGAPGVPSPLSGLSGEPVRRVAIVPDGLLYLVPFEAMEVSRAGPLVIEQMPVTYLPSANLLFRDEQAPPSLPPWRRRLAAFGDPLVNSGTLLPGDERWSKLSGQSRELSGIAATLPGRAAVYSGPGDLKRRLLGDAVAGVPLLHFGTQAAVDVSDSNRSRMLFTSEPGSPGSEYLFRGEAQSLPLEGADLVTISASEARAGPLSRDENVQSFSRAFLAAGARATVTPLWRVEDRARTEFMRLFYEHLGRGESRATALREAKLRFLRGGGAYALPQYWAAFVLMGDGDSPVRPVLSWLQVVAIGAVLIGGAWLYLRRRKRS